MHFQLTGWKWKKILFQKQTSRKSDLEVLRNLYVHVCDLLILCQFPPRVLKYFVVRGQTLHGTFHFRLFQKLQQKNSNFGKSLGTDLYSNIPLYSIESDIVVYQNTNSLLTQLQESLNKDVNKGTLCVYTFSDLFTWYYY